MAHSFRKHPVSGFTTARSEKDDKTIAHRLERRKVRRLLHVTKDFDELVLPVKHELSDLYRWNKDGKCRFGPPHPDADDEELRIFAKLMRK